MSDLFEEQRGPIAIGRDIFWICLTIATFSMFFSWSPDLSVATEPFHQLPSMETVIFSPPTPPRYGFTESDIYLMSVLLTGSKDVGGDGEFDFDYGRQDEFDQISLVLCVVMNRVRSPLYPNTVAEVIWQQNQFSPMSLWKEKLPPVSDISLTTVTAWCDAYDAYDHTIQTIPEEHLYFSGDGFKNYSR